MDNVPESIYNYRINKINLKDGTPVEPGRINVLLVPIIAVKLNY